MDNINPPQNQNDSPKMPDILTLLFPVIAYGISPILFIWAVNTLFNCAIPFTFKTWLAGLILLLLFKFFQRSTHYISYDAPFYDSDEEEEDDKDTPKSNGIQYKDKN